MISPINFSNSIKSNIAPVPKPPKALSFSGLEDFSAQAKQLQKTVDTFVTDKAIPFAKTEFNKAKAQTPKIKKYVQKTADEGRKIYNNIKTSETTQGAIKKFKTFISK